MAEGDDDMTLSALASRLFRPGERAPAGVIINEHTLSAADARRHVDILGRTFEFIHHDDLQDRLARPHGRPFCLLTFDDGKRIGYTETAPELYRLGVPAVFYVTTGFIDGNAPLWFDRYEALLEAAPHEVPGLEADTVCTLPLDDLTERLDRACEMYGVTVDMHDDSVRAMTWADVRALAARGFTIGSHAVRHAVLTRERDADALREIRDSMMDISRELGTPCRTFAFPNGNYTVRLARYAADCGARTVMTTEPTWVEGGAALWHLPRVQLFGPQRRLRIELKLAAAATGRLLLDPNGTGRLYWRIAQLRKSAATRRAGVVGSGQGQMSR